MDFVVARSIVTSDTGEINFKKEPVKKSKDGAGYDPNLGKNFYLFFTKECEITDNILEAKNLAEYNLKKTSTGIIFLEVLMENQISARKTHYIGALILLHTKKDREAIFIHGKLPKSKLEVDYFWVPFSAGSVIGGHDPDIMLLESLRMDYDFFVAANSYVTELVFIKSYWKMMELVDNWSGKQRLSYIATTGDDVSETHRSLQIHEYTWMYFHLYIRLSCDDLQDSHTMHTILAKIKLDKMKHPKEDERSAGFTNFNNGNRLNPTMIKLWNSLSYHYGTNLQEAEEQYHKLNKDLKQTVVVCRSIPELIESKRRELSHTVLYTAIELNSLAIENISSTPGDIFDIDAFEKWRDERMEVIEEKTNIQETYTRVFKDMSIDYKEDVPLRLYGYGCTDAYEPIRTANLNQSMFASDLLPAPGPHSKTLAKYEMPYDNQRMTGTSRALCMAATHMTPIWMSMKEDGGKEFIVIKQKQNGMFTMDDILSKVMTKDGARNIEFISSGLHVSTMIFDIDLSPTPMRNDLNITKLCKDIVDLTNMVLDKLAPVVSSKNVTHYLFHSEMPDPDQPKEKYGIHHHVRLPDNVVMTTEVVGCIVNVLGQIRYLYPDTIGLFAGKKNYDVYDSCIYSIKENDGSISTTNLAIPNSVKMKYHGLRLPGQVKADGKKKLICVYRSDGLPCDAEIPVGAKMAHGPFDGKQRTGTVIHRVFGIKHISDEEYLKNLESERLNNYVKNKSYGNAVDLMKALNKQMVLFKEWDDSFPSKMDYEKMEGILNELWKNGGMDTMRNALKMTRGDRGHRYTKLSIDRVLNGSRIKYSERQNAFMLVSRECAASDGFELCPVRVHNNPHNKGAMINVIYIEDMISFGFWVGGFKSCKKTYLDKVYMQMAGITITNSIKNNVMSLGIKQYDGKGTRIFCCKIKDLSDEENTEKKLDFDKLIEEGAVGTDILDKTNATKQSFNPISQSFVTDVNPDDLELIEVIPDGLEYQNRPISYIMEKEITGVQYLYSYIENTQRNIVTFRSSTGQFMVITSNSNGDGVVFASKSSVLFSAMLQCEDCIDLLGYELVQLILDIMEEKDGQTICNFMDGVEEEDEMDDAEETTTCQEGDNPPTHKTLKRALSDDNHLDEPPLKK